MENTNEAPAVPEGVDTAELRRLLFCHLNASLSSGAREKAQTAIIAHISGLLAQQREAGRREGQQERDDLAAEVTVLEAALATRQSVAPELTDEQIMEMGLRFELPAFSSAEYRASGGAKMTAPEQGDYNAQIGFARALLAASPKVAVVEPVQAEKITCGNCKGAIGGCSDCSGTGFHWEPVEQVSEDTARVQFLIDNPHWSVRWRFYAKKQIQQWQMVDDGESWGQWGEYRNVLDAARRVSPPQPINHTGDVK